MRQKIRGPQFEEERTFWLEYDESDGDGCVALLCETTSGDAFTLLYITPRGRTVVCDYVGDKLGLKLTKSGRIAVETEGGDVL